MPRSDTPSLLSNQPFVFDPLMSMFTNKNQIINNTLVTTIQPSSLNNAYFSTINNSNINSTADCNIPNGNENNLPNSRNSTTKDPVKSCNDVITNGLSVDDSLSMISKATMNKSINSLCDINNFDNLD